MPSKKRLKFLDVHLICGFSLPCSLGVFVDTRESINASDYRYVSGGTTNIGGGLIVMMYTYGKVKYEELGDVFRNTKVLGATLSKLEFSDGSYVYACNHFLKFFPGKTMPTCHICMVLS